MARKTYTGLDQFSKYRKKTKSSHGKALSGLKKHSKERAAAQKKRLRAYEKEFAKEKALKEKQNKTPNKTAAEDNQDGGCFFFVLVGLIILAIVYFVIGLKWLLIIGAIGIVLFIAYVVLEVIKDKNTTHQLSPETIELIQHHLSCIDTNKDIANNSNDAEEVKKALDNLIKSIDFIMQYEENELRQAGATKEKLPAQKDFILQNYDVMIKQAENIE